MSFRFHPEAECEFREAVGYYIIAVMNLHREPGYWKDRS